MLLYLNEEETIISILIIRTFAQFYIHFRFEEMRMRYERRDPRPEDVRQIDELKSIIEAQDKDLRRLTEALRELQMSQQNDGRTQTYKPQRRTKQQSKLNCDIIYEENENDRESPMTIRVPESVK